MCGIVGSLSPLGNVSSVILRDLTQLMARRGPDDEGFWSDDQYCALGFRRLSILDLSPAGHQPMLTPDGRYVIIYNGELYNFQALRKELEQAGIRFRSTSDTEVVLHALVRWGTSALERFNGMFALAFYDSVERRLLLARDHAGIKPLYYLHTAQGLVFASQYNQILAHPWSKTLPVSLEAFGLYLRLGYIPAPYALLQHTHMVEPGSWLEIDGSGAVRQGAYFRFPQWQEPDLRGQDAYDAIDAAVADAVQRQMISDVPIGTFLSGGIDSPLVAAKMSSGRREATPAFTIGTNGDSLDESVDAALYANELGIQHYIKHVTPAQSLAMLNDVVASCGEPFADFSIFPTMLVSQMAQQRVKVVLSGDGGDELFWGYNERFGSVIEKSEDFNQARWLRDGRWALKKYLKLGNGYYNLRIPSIGDWYRAKHTIMPETSLQSLFPAGAAWPADYSLFNYTGYDTNETAQWVRWNEFVGHLTRVLLKVDRASMYHSLEVRVPLLDRDVIATALRVDWRSCLDLQTKSGKIPLRRSLARHLQHQTKAKRGFSVPMNTWLRESLREVFQDSFAHRQDILGIPFNAAAAAELFSQHVQGKQDHAGGLWMLLSLALWEERHYQPHLHYAV